MAVVFKIRRDEMEIVKEAATRVARRSNSRFTIDQTKIKITEDENDSHKSSVENTEEDSKSAAVFD